MKSVKIYKTFMYYWQVLGQGMHQSPRNKHKGESMDALHGITSRASQNLNFTCSNFRKHHRLQHDLSSAPNVLGSTRKFHEHSSLKFLPHSSGFTPSNPLHYAHLPRPSLRLSIRSFCAQVHGTKIRHYSIDSDRIWTVPLYFLHGFSRLAREET